MRLFLVKLLLFLLPLFVLAYPLDFFLSHYLKQSTQYAQAEYAVYNDLYSGNIKAELAIYGSSRAWIHINPQILENSLGLTSYNLGIDGQNFWLQKFRHESYLTHNPAPKYIVFSLDLFTLQHLPELYNAQQFLPYLPHDPAMVAYTKPFNYFSWADYHLPLLRYAGEKWAILHAIKNSIRKADVAIGRKAGFRAVEASWNNDLEKAQQGMDYYEAGLDSTLVKLFDQFLAECKKKDIKVVLVYSPEYIEGQRFVRNRTEFISFYERLATKHKLPFLDYSADSISFNKSFFYNATHLNKAGATLFTQGLATDLKTVLGLTQK